MNRGTNDGGTSCGNGAKVGAGIIAGVLLLGVTGQQAIKATGSVLEGAGGLLGVALIGACCFGAYRGGAAAANRESRESAANWRSRVRTSNSQQAQPDIEMPTNAPSRHPEPSAPPAPSSEGRSL
jgi:hypothetical protein